MEKIIDKDLMSTFDNAFDVLCSLESIIKLTLTSCRDKEICSIYYNLPQKEKKYLSEERNHYINMLTLALDKLTSLKEINLVIEKDLTVLK